MQNVPVAGIIKTKVAPGTKKVGSPFWALFPGGSRFGKAGNITFLSEE